MEMTEFSGLFALIYVCPEHGETWHTEYVEDIDTEYDEVYSRVICGQCHHDVKPLMCDGHQVVHPLTDEEAYWETSSPFDDDEEDDDYGTCPTCGGEFWDGGTSCTCGDYEDDSSL